jgi:hypothetical protein
LSCFAIEIRELRWFRFNLLGVNLGLTLADTIPPMLLSLPSSDGKMDDLSILSIFKSPKTVLSLNA